MFAAGVFGPEAEGRIRFRLDRQEILRRDSGAPRYLAIIDEAALRRPLGSGQLMAEQLRHIVDMAEMPHIDVRIVPFAHGPHVGLEGSFVIMEFAKAPALVYLEHQRKASVFLDRKAEVRPFQEEAVSLAQAALSSADSVKFLRRLAYEYSRE